MEVGLKSAAPPALSMVEPGASDVPRPPAPAPEVGSADHIDSTPATPRPPALATPSPPTPGVCRATNREIAPDHVAPAKLADVIAAARRQGVNVTPEVFEAAQNVLLPTYNDDYRACNLPMFCYDFSVSMRNQLRARFPSGTFDLIELHAHDPSNRVNHYVVRGNFGQGPIIFDATADQFELLEDRPRIGPQLRSEADYHSFIAARGYGSPRVVTTDEQ